MYQTPYKLAQIGEWLIDGNVGQSSKALAAVYLGAKNFREFNLSHPVDPSDLKRCIIFLSIFSEEETNALLNEMARYSIHWAAIRYNWGTLLELYQLGNMTGDGKMLYEKMKDLGL